MDPQHRLKELMTDSVCRLLGNLVLNLWDCGGQESFMENYYRSQKENIFRNVEVPHSSCILPKYINFFVCIND
jgi:hypothetical protein